MTPKTKTRPASTSRSSAGPLTVGQLSRKIVQLLEKEVGRVSVEGEVSNLRVPASGHAYFVLKDSEATINCVCFRGAFGRLTSQIENGKQIEVRGRVTAYAARSEYQIIIEGARAAGLGELMLQFVELKNKLAAAGLFDEDRKKPLPPLPRSIGIVTSSTGAALRDILNVLNRRAMGLDVRISPCAVQGEAAPAQIVRAIKLLQSGDLKSRVDVIIVSRGGGSIEDLWAFNDERVVKAIAACKIPVISGVGHEIDTTLADLASDLRAPTPSAAAEIVTAGYADLAENVNGLTRRLARAQGHRLERARNLLDRLADSWALARPDQILADPMRRVDEAHETLDTLVDETLSEARAQWLELDHRLALANPRETVREAVGHLGELSARLSAASPVRVWGPKLAAQRTETQNLALRLRRAAAARVATARQNFSATADRLVAVGPPSVLKRGYSFITTEGGRRVITGPGQAKLNQTLKVHSHKGTWKATPLPSNEPELFDDV